MIRATSRRTQSSRFRLSRPCRSGSASWVGDATDAEDQLSAELSTVWQSLNAACAFLITLRFPACEKVKLELGSPTTALRRFQPMLRRQAPAAVARRRRFDPMPRRLCSQLERPGPAGSNP